VAKTKDFGRPLRDAAESVSKGAHSVVRLANDELKRQDNLSTYEKSRELAGVGLAAPMAVKTGIESNFGRILSEAGLLSAVDRQKFYEGATANFNKIIERCDRALSDIVNNSKLDKGIANTENAKRSEIRDAVRRAEESGEKLGGSEPTENVKHLADAARNALREMIETRGNISLERHNALRNTLGRLPQDDLLLVHKAGYKAYLTNSVRAAKDRFPSEFQDGAAATIFIRHGIEDATAVTIPETKSMILFTNNGYTGTAYDARHEFAHAMANVCGWEENKLLQEAYQRTASKLRKQFEHLQSEGMVDNRELVQLKKIRPWFANPDSERFREAVADAYAVTHGGSRGAEFDMIFEDKFSPLIKMMSEAQWFRPKVD
jgi:hypothetical protein